MSWENTLQETYYQTGTFRHESPKRISLFPYTTAPITQKTSDEMKSFFSISGEALKDLAMIDNEVDCTAASIFSNVKTKVETQNHSDLQHIIRTILFDDNDQIHCFHPVIFYHLSSGKIETSFSSMAYFVRDILFGNNTNLGPDACMEECSTNIFHSLILKSLPPLSSRKLKRSKTYYKAQDSLCECFVQDCKFLKHDPKIYATHLPELLKIYCFIYQLRLVEQLNDFFNNSSQQPFYFTVYWENLSKSRQAYQGGWRRISEKLFTMWSHVHCLEMLNYIPIEGLEPPYAYADIKRWEQLTSEEDIKKAVENVNRLIDFYKKGIEGLNFDWTRHEHINNDNNKDEDLENRIELFFKMVQCQFANSSRKAASIRYSKWLSQFAANNYFKPRGPLGNTLSFTRPQLLFLTRLCIGENPAGKLRLTELWKEFSRRGVAFDFETQKQILILFNKLNLIEKKSDSGDAQYVRAIF